jgi:hypothetical protein
VESQLAAFNRSLTEADLEMLADLAGCFADPRSAFGM